MDEFSKVVDNEKFRRSNVLVHDVVKGPLMNFMNAMNKEAEKKDKAKHHGAKDDALGTKETP
jgi:hypothetical protein